MKLIAQILLFVFITFLITPTVVSVIQKNADISAFYSFSEEEKAQKEIKAIFYCDDVSTALIHTDINSGLIQSENLSKHNKIASKIFIPPPEQI
jgi:hypothetical protein